MPLLAQDQLQSPSFPDDFDACCGRRASGQSYKVKVGISLLVFFIMIVNKSVDNWNWILKNRVHVNMIRKLCSSSCEMELFLPWPVGCGEGDSVVMVYKQ